MIRTFLGAHLPGARAWGLSMGLLLLGAPAPRLGRADEGTALKPCTIAVKGDSPVQRACKEGGVDRAKATMKRLVGVARGKQHGRHFACDDCHVDEDSWRLTEDARTRFKELLAIAGDPPL